MADISRPASRADDSPEWYHRACTHLDKKTPNKTRIGRMRATLTNAARMWDNEKTITYCFVRPAGTRNQQNKVKSVVKSWEKFVNIKFRFVDRKNATIRIAFDEDDGSWSYVAKDIEGIPLNQATMNLGWITEGTAITDEDRGVILHEFGHSLGFLHELQSQRRAEKLTLDEAAVLEYYMRTQAWTEQEVRQQILDVYKNEEISNFSVIDLTSIMMYFMPAAMNLERIDVPPNNDLSPLDKAYAFLNYPFFPSRPSTDPSINIENSLNIAGVTGEFRASILAEYAQKDWQGVRAEFTRWALNEKALVAAAKVQAKAEAATAAAKLASTASVAVKKDPEVEKLAEQVGAQVVVTPE